MKLFFNGHCQNIDIMVKDVRKGLVKDLYQISFRQKGCFYDFVALDVIL